MNKPQIQKKPVPSATQHHQGQGAQPQQFHDQSSRSLSEDYALDDFTVSPENRPQAVPENEQKHAHPRHGWPRWQWPTVVTLNCIYFTLIGYDVGNIANIQAPIYRVFGELHLLPWVALGYVATGAATVFTIRKMLAVCDMRWQLPVYAGALFIGATVSGSAQNMKTVIIGRCLTGLGGAGIYQCVITFILFFTDAAEYSRYTGLLACFWAVGLILGPIIGAGFAENASTTWRWAFYINLPFLGVVGILTALAYPSLNVDPSTPALTRLRRTDWVGSVVYFSVVVLLFSCLMFSGTTWAWGGAGTIAAWVMVVVLATFFARQQSKALFTTTTRRLVPVDLLAYPAVILSGISASGIGTAYGISIYYTPIFFAFVHGRSPVEGAVRLLPFTAAFVGCALIGAGILPRVKYYAPYYILAGICITIGAGLLTRVSPETSESEIMGLTALVGAGTGMTWAIGATVLTMSVPAARRLDISAVFIFFQIFGIALSLAIGATVYHNVGYQLVSQALQDMDIEPSLIPQLLAGLASDLFESLPPDARMATVEAVTDVISRLYWMLVAAGGLVLVSGFLMDFKPLNYDQNLMKESGETDEEAK